MLFITKDKNRKYQQFSQVLLIIFTLSITLFSLWATRNTTIDDAFISWRQGFNLAKFSEFVFNPNGQDSNGATSTLFGLISAIPVLLGFDVLLFFKLFSLLVIFGYLKLSLKASNPSLTCLFLLLCLGNFTSSIHIWSGLETSTVIIISTYLIYKSLQKKPQINFLFYFAAAILVWIRLDFILLSISLSMYNSFSKLSFLYSTKNYLNAIKFFFREPILKISFISLFIQLIFLKIFSGHYLPTSVMRKSLSGEINISQLIGNIYSVGFWGVITIIFILFIDPMLRKKMAIIFISFGLPLSSIYILSDLQMDFAGRFGFMAFWPMILSSILLLDQIATRSIIGFFMVWVLVFINLSYNSTALLVTNYSRLINSLGAIGWSLEQGNQQIYVVGGDAGLLPYLSTNTTFLDNNGIATRSAEVKFLDDALMSSKLPIVVVSVSQTRNYKNFSDDQGKTLNFMNNQKKMANWAESRKLDYLGYVAYDNEYFNHIWASKNLNNDARVCMLFQIDSLNLVPVNSNSLGLKSDVSFRWKLPKYKCSTF